MKSSGPSLPVRARATRSSKARRKSTKLSLCPSLRLGTSSVRVPSPRATSTAMPRRTLSRWMRCGRPSTSAKASFMRGKVSSARRIAQAMMCATLTFGLAWSRVRFRIWRFSSSVRTGTVRIEVALGTRRLSSMFSTSRNRLPRMGWAMSPGMSTAGGASVRVAPRVASAAVCVCARSSPVCAAGATSRCRPPRVTGAAATTNSAWSSSAVIGSGAAKGSYCSTSASCSSGAGGAPVSRSK